MEIFIAMIIISAYIYLYFINNRHSLIAYLIFSSCGIVITFFQVYRIRIEYLNDVYSYFALNINHQYSIEYYTLVINNYIFVYFSIVIALILLSVTFLLNKNSTSLIYLFIVIFVFLSVPTFTYFSSIGYNQAYLIISNYIFEICIYIFSLLHIPFTIKKTLNYFKITNLIYQTN